jgi:hypothetical protein
VANACGERIRAFLISLKGVGPYAVDASHRARAKENVVCEEFTIGIKDNKDNTRAGASEDFTRRF